MLCVGDAAEVAIGTKCKHNKCEMVCYVILSCSDTHVLIT